MNPAPDMPDTMLSKGEPSPSRPLRITMIVVDARDVRGEAPNISVGFSPILHPAVHNLLDGLRDRSDIRVEVIYGRQSPEENENRHEGSLHFVPVPYKTLPVPGMGGGYIARTIALLAHIRQTNPDLVHAQGTERESGLVAALSGKPSLLTLHGNFREIARSLKAKPFSYLWLNAKIEKWILPRVDGVICISNYTRNLIHELNPRNWVLPNAVNQNMFSVKNTAVPGRVVCIAAIDPRKNQISFMKAADLLAARNPHFHLHFWGLMIEDTPYAREFITEVGLRPWATYQGTSELDGIGQILSESDVLVLPSIEDNCPVVILEAMAAGIPVVASHVGGIPDLVRHGETGFMAAPEDQAELVTALEQILETPALREKLSIMSKSEALLRFQPEKIAEAHVGIYREIDGST
jgi:glycosyltransferase involved in cell wall biosynthesis